MIEKATPSDDKPSAARAAAAGGGGGQAAPSRSASRPCAARDEAEGPAGGPPRPLAQRVEALLFASGQPLTPARLGHGASASRRPPCRPRWRSWCLAWRTREGAIELVEIAGGWRLLTRAAFHPDVAALRRKTEVERLSPAALETLAVVAYRQPHRRARTSRPVRGVPVRPRAAALARPRPDPDNGPFVRPRPPAALRDRRSASSTTSG